MRVASSISSLGTGRFDGEEAFISLSDDGIPLTWHDGSGTWRSPAMKMFELHSAIPIRHSGPGGAWKYLYVMSGNPGNFNRSDFGWDPVAVRNAGAGYSAGLTRQEKIDAVFTSGDGAGQAQMAIVLYPFDQGSSISGLISPDTYVSSYINATADSGGRAWQTSGWQTSAITALQIGTNPILAPHLYTKTLGGSNDGKLYALKIDGRWVGDPTP